MSIGGVDANTVTPAGATAPRESLTWVMGLLGFGTVVMLLFAFSPGMGGVAIAIAARMAFLLILLAAALPWLGRGQGMDQRVALLNRSPLPVVLGTSPRMTNVLPALQHLHLRCGPELTTIVP